MRKVFILFALFCAYALVLGHSIVPHHHHDAVEHLAHDDDYDDHHHGDHQNGLPEFFSHFGHDSHTVTLCYVISKPFQIAVKNNFQFIAVPLVQPEYSQVVFNSDHPPGRTIFLPSHVVFSARSLRAPPVFIG